VLAERRDAALAWFELPRRFVFLDKLLRQAMGKVQKRLLGEES
jgi:acyl-CoA synthetase (AMP-forming)/AMP-acid ligase II